ncbi:MAG: diguanylate cyclase [Proteobacteria bacterium]|nr:diguanylate cyclase [Desulfobacteraceae bacterium]MBU3981173.1 diguanylate cyclase [Pseudomonadota bacterium]MBU4013639.1 diguanylate cyclase [Pseudomonadota bacterium]MBU4069074.1 diguanylate cyclase [Pseudomonadota bacterium]MBU4101200.1 diguanylate cyclase [Pseudomonadota bacterium]
MPTILVIDDSKLIAHVAKNILTKQGHEVLLAQDGETGLDIARDKKPDLILLDLVLPGMDGYGICERIKNDSTIKDIPIIMLTSKAEHADKVRGLELGASDYVTKPFDEGELRARVNTHLRIKELYESVQEKNRLLLEMANRDGLTGLYNHRYFQETIAKDFKKALRYNESLACVMFDIDHFKKFNDTYGHPVGDIVLKTLSELVKNLMRDSDLAARYGGEEFVLILYHTEANDAYDIAERLRKTVEQHKFQAEDLVLSVNISIGVACYYHPDIQDAKTLIECADKALYRAKEEGRNRVVAFWEIQPANTTENTS